jgi:hypothetical protein
MNRWSSLTANKTALIWDKAKVIYGYHSSWLGVPPTHPQARRQIAALGKRLRAARLRRDMSQDIRLKKAPPPLSSMKYGMP